MVQYKGNMHKRQSRNRELIRRILVYAAMTVAMLSLLVVFTYRILGYQFNFATRTVERTGLVQYDSFPRGAAVTVDGERLSATTRTKGVVLPGVRQVSMSLDGYHDWQKNLDVKAGTVTWLDYARLVPIEKRVEDVQYMGDILSVRRSSDNRFMAGVSRDAEGLYQFVLIDFRDSRQPRIVEQPLETSAMAGFLEEQAVEHSFGVEGWDESSRGLLVRHVYSGDVSGSEWFWIDRDRPQEMINISTLTNLSVVDVRHGNDGEVYILQANGDLRKLTLSTGAVSRPLLSQVVSFDIYDGSTIYYIGTQSNAVVAGLLRDGWSSPVIVRSASRAEGESLEIAVSRYFNQDTMVISEGASVLIYRGDLPTNAQQKDVFMEKPFGVLTLNRPLNHLSISENGRLVIAEDSQGFVSFDLELKLISQQVRKYDSLPVEWVDRYHVWQIDEASNVLMQEYDGVNSHSLMAAARGYDVLLTQDGRFMYAFGGDTEGRDGVSLRRLHMTVDAR